jgi:hypothetical protein
MSFKNKSTENKLKQLSTLGPNLFAGNFFDFFLCITDIFSTVMKQIKKIAGK